ncbi:hypothetical protein DSCA_30200 [Desulfosarcina alkanivorans]|uniref:Uncharacterized protein n=1 Tax=Desulfosarcina alkanivorans TaxID=571177 RepID=A0A5K7YLK4_9BACT|nr:hypothetical protein [Desulfosarcina alkanivorans]BBO69090.1 hypothetical protein DSCA_30200 [Desulfosarcina alkanivorans]
MGLNDWIAGDDSVDPSLNLKKVLFLSDATALCASATLQRVHAKQKKVTSNYKEIALSNQNIKPKELDSLLPLENHFASNPKLVEYMNRLLEVRNDDDFALQALQEMMDLDFDCNITEPLPDGYWKRFEKTVMYSSVLYRLFHNLIPDKNYEGINGKIMQQIDFSMSKILYSAGQIGATSVEQTNQYDSQLSPSRRSSTKAAERQEYAVELYNSIPKGILKRLHEIKDKMEELQARWIMKYGDDNVPSLKTLQRYLKKAGTPIK